MQVVGCPQPGGGRARSAGGCSTEESRQAPGGAGWVEKASALWGQKPQASGEEGKGGLGPSWALGGGTRSQWSTLESPSSCGWSEAFQNGAGLSQAQALQKPGE